MTEALKNDEQEELIKVFLTEIEKIIDDLKKNAPWNNKPSEAQINLIKVIFQKSLLDERLRDPKTFMNSSTMPDGVRDIVEIADSATCDTMHKMLLETLQSDKDL